jgi:HAD superfamily hydrolase (TIGR01458 family)
MPGTAPWDAGTAGSGMEAQGFLIDLDGVLYVGDVAIAGAQDALDLLGRKHYRYRFVSNTTRKCRDSVAQRLRAMGFSIDPSSIFTPPLAAIARMKGEGKRRCLLLTTGDVFRDFEQHGITNREEDTVDYVVVGDAGDAMTYQSLNLAFRLLNAGAGLIALEKDRYWMGPDGLMLSAGPFVAALEYATGISAAVMGKPSRQFFDMALAAMGLPADQVMMIGDDIQTDIGGAQRAGMKAVLVRTGKFSQESLDRSGITPDEIIDSIGDIADIL